MKIMVHRKLTKLMHWQQHLYLIMFLNSARFYLLLFYITAFFINTSAQNDENKGMVSQKFVYKTAQAGEVYIVWATDYWRTPAKQFWPKNTYLQDKFAYT